MDTPRAVVDYWHAQLDAAEAALDGPFDVYRYEPRSDLLAETTDKYLLDKAPNTYPVEQDFQQTAMSDRHDAPEISIVETIRDRADDTGAVQIGRIPFKEPIPYNGAESVGRATVEYRVTADTDTDTVERYFTIDTDAITTDDADTAAYVEQIRDTLQDADLSVYPDTASATYSGGPGADTARAATD